MTEFERDARSASKYKQLVRAADELGFKPVKHHYTGTWKTQGGDLAWPVGSETRGVGRKYFEVKLDGEWFKIRPHDRDAYVAVTFSDDRRRF